MTNLKPPKVLVAIAWVAIASLTLGCSLIRQEREPYTTKRDKARKGASIGAAAGAAAAILKGEREADEILAGAIRRMPCRSRLVEKRSRSYR